MLILACLSGVSGPVVLIYVSGLDHCYIIIPYSTWSLSPVYLFVTSNGACITNCPSDILHMRPTSLAASLHTVFLSCHISSVFFCAFIVPSHIFCISLLFIATVNTEFIALLLLIAHREGLLNCKKSPAAISCISIKTFQ